MSYYKKELEILLQKIKRSAINPLIHEENPKISREKSLPVPSSGHVLIKERCAWRVLSSGALVRRGDKTADVSAPPRN